MYRLRVWSPRGPVTDSMRLNMRLPMLSAVMFTGSVSNRSLPPPPHTCGGQLKLVRPSRPVSSCQQPVPQQSSTGRIAVAPSKPVRNRSCPGIVGSPGGEGAGGGGGEGGGSGGGAGAAENDGPDSSRDDHDGIDSIAI